MEPPKPFTASDLLARKKTRENTPISTKAVVQTSNKPGPTVAPDVILSDNDELNDLRCDLLCEFFELALHAVLYYRDLYPRSFFQRMSKYEVPVWVATHPTIRQYVENCIKGIQPALQLNRIRAVIIAVLTPEKKIPVERFVFRIVKEGREQVAMRTKGGASTPMPKVEASMQHPPDDKLLFRFGEALKAFSLRIAACKSYLKPLPPNCSCVLQIVTDARTQLALSAAGDEDSSFPWIEADDRERRPLENGRMQSVRGPTFGVCPLEMSVEEAGNKFAPIFRTIKTATKK